MHEKLPTILMSCVSATQIFFFSKDETSSRIGSCDVCTMLVLSASGRGQVDGFSFDWLLLKLEGLVNSTRAIFF